MRSAACFLPRASASSGNGAPRKGGPPATWQSAWNKLPGGLRSGRGYIPNLGTPVEFIGYVEAENEKQAIKQAIKQFQISDIEKQKWLVAHRVK